MTRHEIGNTVVLDDGAHNTLACDNSIATIAIVMCSVLAVCFYVGIVVISIWMRRTRARIELMPHTPSRYGLLVLQNGTKVCHVVDSDVVQKYMAIQYLQAQGYDVKETDAWDITPDVTPNLTPNSVSIQVHHSVKYDSDACTQEPSVKSASTDV